METALAVETLARPTVRAETVSPAPPCNVVILTVGWTGSSMLAGLLRAAGFWTGTTVRNTDYDTFENAELVRLNRKLLTMAGIGEGYATHFHPGWYARVERLAHTVNRSQFTGFIDECRRHAPWLWKDPRLWVTIGFWRNLLPTENVKYLLLTREPLQAWISCTLRRQIQTFGYLRRYNASTEGAMRRFLVDHNAPHLHIVHEDLQLSADRELARLSKFLEAPVTLGHLLAIHDSGRLNRRNRRIKDFCKAVLIHAKNYRERLR